MLPAVVVACSKVRWVPGLSGLLAWLLHSWHIGACCHLSQMGAGYLSALAIDKLSPLNPRACFFLSTPCCIHCPSLGPRAQRAVQRSQDSAAAGGAQ